MSRLTRDGTAEPVSRDQILRHARGQGKIIFPVQLTTSRIGNLTRLIHTLLYVMTIHTYIHTHPEHNNLGRDDFLGRSHRKSFRRPDPCNENLLHPYIYSMPHLAILLSLASCLFYLSAASHTAFSHEAHKNPVKGHIDPYSSNTFYIDNNVGACTKLYPAKEMYLVALLPCLCRTHRRYDTRPRRSLPTPALRVALTFSSYFFSPQNHSRVCA